jgi:hypothetical protein
MSGDGVSDDDMPSIRWSARRDESALADESLAALLAGAQPPEDAPPDLRRALDVLAALQAGPARDELAAEAAALAEFRINAAWPRPANRPGRRRPVRLSSLAAKVAAVTAVAVVAIGGVAAAVGVLPTPLQRVAHDDFGFRPPSTHRGKHKAKPAGRASHHQHGVAASGHRPSVSDHTRPRHHRCGAVWLAHPRASWTPTVRRDPLRGQDRWLTRQEASCARWYWRHLHQHRLGWQPAPRRGRLPGRHHLPTPAPYPTPRPSHHISPRPSSQPTPGRSSQPARPSHPRRLSRVTRT